MSSDPTAIKRPSSRILQLDVLRGLAILMVLFRHGFPPGMSASLRPLVWHLYCASVTGIDMFFILSGFLIGGLLFKEVRKTGRLDVRRFLIRRSFRIWPGYYAFIVFLFFRLGLEDGFGQACHELLPNLVHLQNYLQTPRGMTWSLAVQEHFYLLLPLLLWALTRGRERVDSLPAVPMAACAAVVLCTAGRVLYHTHESCDFFRDVTPTHLRIDGLFFGVLLAYLHHFHHEALARIGRRRWTLLLIGAALICYSWFINEETIPFTWTWGYTLLYVGYGCVLVAAIYCGPSDGPLGKALASRPARALAWVGVFSYSIYLWHWDLGYTPVNAWLLPRLPQWRGPLNWLILMAAHFALSIGAGIAAAKLIELPAIALRDRLFPARAAAPTIAAPIQSPVPLLPIGVVPVG